MSNQKKQEEALYKYQMDNLYSTTQHKNPHDIAGIRGFTVQQMQQLENKKIKYRVQNEVYLRKHPELNKMISVFLFKVLEEKPADILTYAGDFFDQPELDKIISIQTKHYLSKNQQ